MLIQSNVSSSELHEKETENTNVNNSVCVSVHFAVHLHILGILHINGCKEE